MQLSIFAEYVEKWFAGLVGRITEKINSEKTAPTMMHKTMLTEEYSADLTWGSSELDQAVVAADVVSLESSLPLKKRDKIDTASGQIPKLGVKYRKGEKAISDINVMIARGMNQNGVIDKIFDDAARCIKAIDVRKEIMFRQALSEGATIIKDGTMYDGNDGTGIRVGFGGHTCNVSVVWGRTNYAPVTDLHSMIDEAESAGNTIAHLWLAQSAFDKIRTSDEGKTIAATYQGFPITSDSVLATPTRATFQAALEDELGVTIHIVKGTFREELPSGERKTVNPWLETAVVGTPSENVGRLVYGTLAEETNPVSQVAYQKSGTHTLVSKYSKTDPLEEFTAAQALCLPVIDGSDGIYRLETDKTGVIVLDKEELTFTKSADSTGKTVTATADTAVTATAEEGASWVTVTVADNVITVKVSANSASSAPARDADVTVADANGVTATFTVKQAANT